MADAKFKWDIINFVIFWYGQVTDIRKPPHVKQYRNFAANDKQSFSGKLHFQKVTSPRVLTFCISWIFIAVHLRSCQSPDLPIISLWENTEIAHFCNINDRYLIRIRKSETLNIAVMHYY